MTNDALNDAVARLLSDRGFLRRFRRDPGKALRRYGLDDAVVEAVKRGDEEELLALGLSPELIWPELRPRSDAARHTLVRKAVALAPAAFAAALLAAFPATAGAAKARDARIVKASGRHGRAVKASGRNVLIARPALKRAALEGAGLKRAALYPHRVRAARAAKAS